MVAPTITLSSAGLFVTLVSVTKLNVWSLSQRTKVLTALVCIITNLNGFAKALGINKSLMVISKSSWYSMARP